MIKKILAISLSAIYMTISVGFPISIHHCHGQNEISIALDNESECCCAADHHEVESFCSIEIENLQPSQTNYHTPGCCTHETKVVYFDSKQQIFQKEEITIQITEIDLYDSKLLFENKIEEVSNKFNREYLSKSPPKTIPLQVLNQEFIFYG